MFCVNDWTLSLQNKRGITIVYIDFAKAFDTVSHEKLLYRLGHYGIGGNVLKWLQNFLTNRTHRLTARVGNCMSEFCDLLSGVIQGSNIGPLLFISFINELAVYCTWTTVEVSVRAAAAEIIAADFYAAPTDTLLPKKIDSSCRQQGSSPIVC